MNRKSDAWRRDLLRLAMGLEEDLTELHASRPAAEASGTLDVFVQGLVRAWRDMGFSSDEIARALEHGADDQFQLDPAWENERQERQAWAAANSGRFGEILSRIQSLGAMAAFCGLLGSLVVAGFNLSGLPFLISIGSFAAGIVLMLFASQALKRRKARRLAALKRGASLPLEF